MSKHRSDNLRIRRRYLVWLREARGYSEASVDKVAASVARYQAYLGAADFRQFHSERALGFKRHLAKARHVKSKAPLSRATLDATLRDVKNFMAWLADQPGYRSHVRHADAVYFTPDRKSARSAHQGLWKPHPSADQLCHAIEQMPIQTIYQRRDRALMAFLCLTGSRETAAMTIRLNHVDLTQACVHFDARTVETKFGKSFTTSFFPVGASIIRFLADWIAELKRDQLWGPTDPLFPKTCVGRGPTGDFAATGFLRAPWRSPARVVKIFKSAFTAVGLPPFSPHRVRDTLVELASAYCSTPEEFKSWSQNAGHEDVLTTFRSYGSVAPGRQAEVMARLRRKSPKPRDSDFDVIE